MVPSALMMSRIGIPSEGISSLLEDHKVALHNAFSLCNCLTVFAAAKVHLLHLFRPASAGGL